MPGPNDPVAIVSPTGQAGTAPAHAVEALLSRGYKLDQGEGLAEREAQRYSGIGQAAAAAAQGAARVAIPGYDAAAQAIVGALPGGDSERTRRYLAGLKQHQAGASMAGEMLGYVLPAGAGGLMGRAGMAAERAVVGAGGGALRTMGGAVARGAVEGAAAGIGEGLSEVALDEAPLTGERLAGALGASVMRGAGYGAGAAGALHLGGLVGGSALRSTRDALARRIPKGDGEDIGLVGRMLTRAQSLATGADVNDLRKLWAGQSAKRAVMDAPLVREAATKSIASDLTEVLGGGRKLKPLHVGGEREATFAHLVDGDIGAQATQARSVVANVRDALDGMAAVPGKQARKAVKPVLDDIREQVDDLAKQMEEAIANGDGAAVNQRLNAIKQRIGDLKKSADAGAGGVGRKRVYWQEPARIADELYETARKSLEDQAVWGRAGAAQAAINKPTFAHLQYKDFHSKFTRRHGQDKFDDLFVADDDKVRALVDKLGDGGGLDKDVLSKVVQGRADSAKALLEHARPQMSAADVRAAESVISAADRIKKTLAEAEGTLSLESALKRVASRDGVGGAGGALLGGVLGGGAGAALGGALGAVTAPGRTITQLAALQNVTGRMGDRVGSSLRGLFSGAKPGGIGYAVPRLVQPLDNKYSEDHGYKLRAEATKLRQSTPAQVAADTDRALRPELTRAPSVVDAAAAAAARQHAALRAASPDPVGKYLLGPAPTPSATEVDRFERAKRAVADYPGVLEDVRDGTVSPDAIATLRSVYPAEYAAIQQKAMDQMAELAARGKTLPYEQRRALGLLLDAPVEPLQDPELVRDIQATFAPVEPAPGRMPSATPRQRRERANSYRTGSQDTAADAEG